MSHSVLVTGGTRGIGKAIAHRLVADGATKAVLGYMRNDEAAEAAAEELRATGAEVVLVRGNVADEKTVAELASHGPYRVVVSNAATGVVRPALETEDKHWDWTLNANARSLLALARACAPTMDEGGSIVAISSLGSQRVLPNYVLIGVSKAALETCVKYLGVELAPADPRQLRLGRRRRHRGARLVPEQGADARRPSSGRRPDGSSSRRTWPRSSRSSARPTRR